MRPRNWLTSDRRGRVSKKARRQWNKTDLYGRCLGCENQRTLTRHHLVPRAMRGVSQTHECVTICRPCHDVVHKVWGPGDRFTGPTTKKRLLRELREVLDRRGIRMEEVA